MSDDLLNKVSELSVGKKAELNPSCMDKEDERK